MRRLLVPALAALSLSACVDPYYYDAYYHDDGYHRDGHYGRDYDQRGYYRRVAAIDEVRFARVPGQDGMYQVVVRGTAGDHGWSEPALRVVDGPARPGELVLVLEAVPPGDAPVIGPHGEPLWPGGDGRFYPRDGVYPADGVYSRANYGAGDVVVARFLIDGRGGNHVVRVLSASNELSADLRDPRWGR